MEDQSPVQIGALLARLPSHRRQIVERFLFLWPHHRMGQREILLVRGNVTVIRIGADYRVPHIIIKPEAGLQEEFLSRLKQLEGATVLPVEGVEIPIDSLSTELVDDIVGELGVPVP